MNIDMMTCEEMREEIIRMIQEIDDEKLLGQIYHFVKKILRMERNNE